MNTDEFQYWLELAAIAFGVMVACVTIFAQVSKGVEKLLVYRKSVKDRRSTRNLLIRPEPEEIAKYSIKNHQDLRAEQQQHEQELERRNLVRSIEISVRTKARLVTLMIFFTFGFGVIAATFAYHTFR
ncbi:hypothetical protein [Falsiruegeria litorea]|uniref:hypothetical protein n=1 Tax=Falsiruegeria litorea TaxID=1280831 RepID=UPI001056A3B8|nr:hypothetical protein [Falsiruegeria litorea]